MTKSNKVAAVGLLAAFAQLAIAQPAYAADEESQQQQTQEPSQVQQPQDGLVGLMIEFYERLFDSQNN